MSDIKSNSELKEKFLIFYKLARQSLCQKEEDFREIIKESGFPNIRRGFLFKKSSELDTAQNQLIALCVKILGPKFDHEEELASLAWDCVLNIDEDQKSFQEFSDSLIALSSKDYTYIMPNYLFRFKGDIKKIIIGPVEATLSSGLIPELEKVTNPKSISFQIGDPPGTKIVPPVIHQTLRDVSWRVKANCSKHNAEEESLWLVNIAISFFRLTYKGHDGGLFPRLGEVEPIPNLVPKFESTGIAFTEAGVTIGGCEIPKSYLIDDAAYNFSQTKKFKEQAENIFEANKGSLSERLSQGLGWLTKGRQSYDKAEKFLFFFTAIEALLSSDDKAAPVVQTISRHVATIISKTVQHRHETASEIKKLYSLRSSLVHTGKRDVSKKDVIIIQFYAEVLFARVLEILDLKIKLSTFQDSLNKASYGTDWP